MYNLFLEADLGLLSTYFRVQNIAIESAIPKCWSTTLFFTIKVIFSMANNMKAVDQVYWPPKCICYNPKQFVVAIDLPFWINQIQTSYFLTYSWSIFINKCKNFTSVLIQKLLNWITFCFFLKKAKDILENYAKTYANTEFLGLAAADGAGPSPSIVI